MSDLKIHDLEHGLGRIAEVIEFYILEELATRFENFLAPKIINNLMNAYIGELAPFAPGYDEANPMNTGKIKEFRQFLENDVSATFKRDLSNKEISVSIGDVLELGYDMSSGIREKTLQRVGVKNPSLFYWLIFYLEGVSGSYYFMSKEAMKKAIDVGIKSPSSLTNFGQWGWYGDGFLIGEKEYNKKYKPKGVILSKHPFSGKAPTKLFEAAMNGIDFQEFVNECISSALKRI